MTAAILVKYFLLALCVGVACINGARIMGVVPMPAPSHNILVTQLLKALAARGHEVTIVSPFPAKDTKNYRAVELTGLLEDLEEFRKGILKTREQGMMANIQHFSNMSTIFAEATLNHTNFQKLLKNEKFDLIIVEAVFNEAHVGIGYHFNAPVIVLSPIGSNPMVNKYVGNPAPTSYVPNMFVGYTGTLSFTQRLMNTIGCWIMDLVYDYHQLPKQEEILHKYFPDAPSLKELIREYVALVLLNAHPSFELPKPLVPNMVHIGGYHVAAPKELPQDLKTYLDNARLGFVLFSLGSNMQSNMLPAETREGILKVFAQLPFKVLWKFEDEDLPGKPDNVMISKWLPQNDILAHPNIKLFITHGGLLSTTEAIYHGVPVVGIPIFGDQEFNMARAEGLGIGTTVPFNNLTFESLSEGIKKVINNKQYRLNVRERSRLMRDQPLPPMDNAMFWIEYVLRNKNMSHFKTDAINLEWYQLYLVDVYATLAGGLISLLGIFYILVKKCCCGKKHETKYPKETKQKKN